MQCWYIVDELRDVTSNMSGMTKSNNLDANSALTLLNSISELYDFKFQKLFNTYSDYLHEQHAQNSNKRRLEEKRNLDNRDESDEECV